MLITLGVLLVTSLLLAAAFLASEGDISLSHHNTNFKQAYYAAVAGIQEYADHLQLEPNYWQTCPKLENVAIGSTSAPETYTVKPLPAERPTTGKAAEECEPKNVFASMIERAGSATGGSFRIESTGKAGESTRKVVATFKQSGFLNYVYFTDYEDEAYGLDKAEPPACNESYYEYRVKENLKCGEIEFGGGDSVYGPMFTDDGALVCGKVVFGRAGHNPPDTVEMGEGAHAVSASGCSGSAEYFDKVNEEQKENRPETTKEKLEPPTSDESLTTYVLKEPGNDYEFEGLTHIVLKGETLEVTEQGATEPKTLKWPENGLIYVKESSKGCGFAFGEGYEKEDLDTTAEEEEEAGCGTVYVEGYYAEPLTIAAQNDVVIHGNILPSAISKEGQVPPPSDTATLGLIANEYVRVFHPLKEACELVTIYEEVEVGKYRPPRYEKREKKKEVVCKLTNENGPARLQDPWIYAAILTTKGSFIVDNYEKGAGSTELGHLNVYGAIAQDHRGIVAKEGSNGTTEHGYLKDYIYDERLAVDEPPYFLQPLNAEWKVIRETATAEG
jgi:hypothetical protein